MLSTSRLVCFIATARPAEAKRFYGETLGLTAVEESPFAIVYNAGEATLRVQIVERVVPTGYTALGWEVEDIKATVKALNGKGITCERYQGLEQDALGIWSAPNGARVAWFRDPDGNTLSLTQDLGRSRSAAKGAPSGGAEKP